MLAGTTFCVLSATCYVGLNLLERYLEGEAREKGPALLSGEAVEEDQATALARLLLIFFPTCRLPASACAEEASRERSGTCQERAKTAARRGRRAAPDAEPGNEWGAARARPAPRLRAPQGAGQRRLPRRAREPLLRGPLRLTSRAFRTAAVARALLPACVTLDVAVAQIAALMDLGREQVAGFKILNFAAVLVLHSSGFDVSALYGGFGLWGVVIGYASRNILEDLFAGLLIVYRRWFTVGDYVVVGGVGGTVEEVWVTSTKIKLFSNGERIHMANSKILASGVVNHNERTTRRVNKYWHLAHDSDPAAFGEAPYFGAHVMNLELDGILVENVYFIKNGQSAVLWKRLETATNLAALRALKDLGLKLAARYPARS
ncbi:Mechanosensitive ion channel [Aureococcus anophagefferens]|nr:Mechanosensitive ion channel [Aureococcus anophagefferens]